MKKTMILGAAALAGLAAMAVESSVVGYNKVDLLGGGKKMVGACFVTPGGTEKMKLSTLRVTGYEESQYYLTEDMAFSATFQIRQSNGMPKETYMYVDETEDLETWNGGHWRNLTTGEDVTSENDVVFEPGTGFWFQAPELQDCTGFQLVSCGKVLTGDQSFTLTPGTKAGVCNMLPTPAKLSTIEIQGYEDNEYYLTEDMAFSLTMQKLLPTGMPETVYLWVDETEDLETWNGGHWRNLTTGADVTSENDVTIPAGEGFWVAVPDGHGTSAFSFVIPKALD